MSQQNISTGRRGEDLAAAFFVARGFRVVSRNWRARAGEIDLIVQKGDTLHFVEVKTRQSTRFGFPEEAITSLKLRHLQRAMDVYLLQFPHNGPIQVDAIAILMGTSDRVEVRYIPQIL